MGNHNLVDQEHWNHDCLNHRNIDWVESPIKIYQVESPVMLDRVRNPGETEHCQLWGSSRFSGVYFAYLYWM